MPVRSIADNTAPEARTSRVRLDRFDRKAGLDRGRPFIIEAFWLLVKCVFFLSSLPWPSGWRCRLLHLFGAKIGEGVVIKPRVNVHFPWKLAIGNHTWIGEGVFILNLEPVTIGDHACISQRAFLCTGNHDYRDPSFPYRNAPIIVADGAWIGAQAFVAPGVSIGIDAVASAGSVVVADLPPAMVCTGNPCTAKTQRWNHGKSPPTDAPPHITQRELIENDR